MRKKYRLNKKRFVEFLFELLVMVILSGLFVQFLVLWIEHPNW